MIKARCLSSPLVFAVTLAAFAAPAHARPNNAAPDDAAPVPRAPSRAFIKLDLPLDRRAHALYVGQAAPVTIHAYFLAGTGVTMTGLPRITSDSLVLSNLSAEPRQSAAEIHGQPYTMLTWNGVLTAVKEGAAKPEIELPVQLSYREAPRMRSLGGFGGAFSPSQQDPQGRQNSQGAQDSQDSDDPFASMLRQSPFASDPLFAQMFKGGDPFGGMFADLAGAVRQRDVMMRDAAGTLNIAALPADPPPGFTGAVGSFDVAMALDGGALRVGEPATLKLTVKGRGSFSRLSMSGVAPSADLGTYGVTSTFEPGATPLAGEKTFSQTIVPRRAGSLIIPASTLTYFDPNERRYVSRHTSPRTVSAAANTSASESVDVSPAHPGVGVTPVLPDSPRSSVVVPSVVPNVTRATLAPAIRTRWFWETLLAIGLAAAALSILGLLRRRGAFARAATTRRVRRAVAAQRREMSAAAARGDAAALFAAGRSALQTRLGATWELPCEAIAAVDVTSRLGQRGERIREVFERADRLRYSRAQPAPAEDLQHWQSVIAEELGALETTS